ncbi:MAG: TrmH family RNA methyltransferase [Trueperaceae bacterium]
MDARARGGEPPRVVLVAPKHAANVGAAARAVANFGLGGLWLVSPRCSLDKEAYALAVHGAPVLDAAVTVATLDEALADRELAVATSARRRRHHGHASADPEDVLAELVGRRSALVFGPEESGLDNDALDRCQRVVTVPTAGHSSINLAQTVVVLGYVWHRTASAGPRVAPAAAAAADGEPGGAARGGVTSPSERPPRAARAQVEAMLGQLRALMRRVGYSDAARETAVLRKYRALLTRIDLDADEVTLLRGLWYQLAWAVEQVPERLPGPRLRGWEDEPATDGDAAGAQAGGTGQGA